MPINFIPNDPLAVNSLPMRQKQARRNRPASRAGFTFVNQVNQALYNPGTPGFLFWQCREAALMALETWEALNGKLTAWARATPNAKKLALQQNNGVDLNAYYDGQSLAFFEFTTGTKTTFSGASTDVVAHEAGHAFLDTIRPDLWDSNLTEPNAFHEAFGDCMAILTMLFDQETRQALLAASADLSAPNFVEATAEDLSDGVRLELGPSHPAALPRHALNNFRWQLPTTLPSSAPPAALSSEIHSFGRVFSGCFYDVIRNIFTSYPNRDEASLLMAAQTAGKLLIGGARSAPETPRFFQAVGRAMILTDQTLNGGANRQAVRDAFDRHNIALGSAAMMAPRAALAGAAPKVGLRATGAILSAATRADLRQRIGAGPKSKMIVNALEIAGERVAEAIHHREISLAGVSNQLKGVVAMAAEPILVGNSGGRAAILGALPESSATMDEVYSFVDSLLKNNQIEFAGTGRRTAAVRRGAVALTSPPITAPSTHAVRTRGGKKVLERLRFVCNCRLR
jgi:Fungalysin metallopeptidase (M36)